MCPSHNTNSNTTTARQETWQPECDPLHHTEGHKYSTHLLPTLAVDLQSIINFFLSLYFSNVFTVKSMCQMASDVIRSPTIATETPVVTSITDQALS